MAAAIDDGLECSAKYVHCLASNNHWSRADFAAKSPGLDWATFFTAAGLGASKRFVVWQPGAARGISALAASEPLETWKDYLTFHAIQ